MHVGPFLGPAEQMCVVVALTLFEALDYLCKLDFER